MKLIENELLENGGDIILTETQKKIYIEVDELCELLIEKGVDENIKRITNYEAVIYLNVFTGTLVVEGTRILHILREFGLECWSNQNNKYGRDKPTSLDFQQKIKNEIKNGKRTERYSDPENHDFEEEFEKQLLAIKMNNIREEMQVSDELDRLQLNVFSNAGFID